jgi:hypothetical protein
VQQQSDHDEDEIIGVEIGNDHHRVLAVEFVDDPQLAESSTINTVTTGNVPKALAKFGSGEWKEFFCVADSASDISLTRPFYPQGNPKGRKQADLIGALGFNTMDELLRACELKTPTRHADCSIFWTLGGNQAGKGQAIGDPLPPNDGSDLLLDRNLRKFGQIVERLSRQGDFAAGGCCGACDDLALPFAN